MARTWASATSNRRRPSKAQFDDYVRSGGRRRRARHEIAQAKSLLDSGAITQAEYDSLKAKALAS